MVRSKTNSLTRRVWQRLKEHGPMGIAHAVTYRIREAYYEWSLGIRTADHVAAHLIGVGPDGEDYFPTDYQLFERAIRRITVHPWLDVFLDIGCGKGRLLIMAAKYPFRRVIGIDFSEELCRAARENVKSLRPAERDRVEVIQADATAFQVPDEVTVIFMFNPFTGRVLQQSLERIRESLLRSPRVLWLYYLQPAHHENLLDMCQWLVCRAVLTTAPRFDMRLYEYVGWALPSEQLQTRLLPQTTPEIEVQKQG